MQAIYWWISKRVFEYSPYKIGGCISKGCWWIIEERLGEYYNYISYKSKEGEIKQALFIFSNLEEQGEFFRAFLRWKEQEENRSPITEFQQAKVHRIPKVEIKV